MYKFAPAPKTAIESLTSPNWKARRGMSNKTAKPTIARMAARDCRHDRLLTKQHHDTQLRNEANKPGRYRPMCTQRPHHHARSTGFGTLRDAPEQLWDDRGPTPDRHKAAVYRSGSYVGSLS